MVQLHGKMLLQQLRVNTQNHNILVIIKKGDNHGTRKFRNDNYG